jgi:hypothetical protein
MDLFAPFTINIEFKGQTYSGTVSLFSSRGPIPFFFRVILARTYWADLSNQHGYWKCSHGLLASPLEVIPLEKTL